MADFRVWILVAMAYVAAFVTTSVGIKAQDLTPPAAPATSQPPAADQLPALARAAKATFVPRTDADLQRARVELVAAVAQLESRLRAAGPGSRQWKDYLMWEELQRQLARAQGPELSTLDKIYARFAAGYDGLELVWFEQVRDALRQYLNTARAIGDAQLPGQYQGLMEELAKHLEAYLRDPSPEEASAIGTALDWLHSAGQAQSLVEAIRSRLARPNVVAKVSADLVAAVLTRPVEEITPIEDCILGTAIYGTGQAKGQATAELVPNSQRGEVHIVFSGTVYSDSVGYHGPVQIFSNGVTTLESRKPLYLDPERLWASPAVSSARTSSDLVDIQTRRAFVERLAWRSATRQQPLANEIASDHAAERASARADEYGDPQVAQADQKYQERFRKRLFERNILPRLLQYSSTKSALHAVGLEAGPADLGAPDEPPPVSQPLDLTVQVHQSMVNNVAEQILAGAVLTEERLQANMKDLLGALPDWLKSEPQADPWTVTFARRQPVSITFGKDRFQIVVRGRSYSRGEDRYPGMNVTATYRIEPSPQGVRAIREGELAIYPPGFQPGAGKQLSVRQQVLRDLLKRRFDKMFDRQVRPEDIQLRGQDGRSGAGSLTLVQWEVTPGWMTLNWKRVPPAAGAAAPPQNAKGPQ